MGNEPEETVCSQRMSEDQSSPATPGSSQETVLQRLNPEEHPEGLGLLRQEGLREGEQECQPAATQQTFILRASLSSPPAHLSLPEGCRLREVRRTSEDGPHTGRRADSLQIPVPAGLPPTPVLPAEGWASEKSSRPTPTQTHPRAPPCHLIARTCLPGPGGPHSGAVRGARPCAAGRPRGGAASWSSSFRDTPPADDADCSSGGGGGSACAGGWAPCPQPRAWRPPRGPAPAPARPPLPTPGGRAARLPALLAAVRPCLRLLPAGIPLPSRPLLQPQATSPGRRHTG